MEVEVNLTQLWIIISVVICSLTEQTCGVVTYMGACDSEDLVIRQEVVYPVLVNNSEIQQLTTYNLEEKAHKAEVLIGIRYNSQDFILKLRHNSGIVSAKPYQDSGLPLNTPVTTIQNCYYQGFVEKSQYVEDFATVSTCDGLRGVVHLNGEAFSIQPLMTFHKPQVCQPHTIAKLELNAGGHCDNKMTQWTSFTKLHSAEYHKRLSTLSSSKVLRSDASWVKRNLESKHLALGLVVDNTMSGLFEHNESRIREYLLDVTNLIDLYYQRLNVRVSLVYMNIWSSGDSISITTRTRETLQNLLVQSKPTFSDHDIDSLHLLSGKEFEGRSSGISIPDSICTDRAMSVISVKSILSNPEKLASTISHMIGHNIGLEHDIDGCECNDVSGKCIMNDIIGGSPSYQFSSCSMERLELLTRVKLGQCLTSQPESSFYPQICGNGIIERGEQCDCGPVGACGQIDPCCNATTCLLKSWATCRAGSCCEGCLPKTTQSLCRAGQNDCDAPEYCDGMSGECPSDESIQNGQPCDNGEGVCYQGVCPTKSKQCKLLWGDDSQSSPDTCYNTNNVLGSLFGHCGQTVDRYYQRCAPKDAVCGLLQCSGGGDSPIISNVKHSEITTRLSEDTITCKMINDDEGSHQFNKGLVSEGTKCGEDHLCMGYSCVHVSALYARGCPVSPITNTTCSSHGRCTTSMQCSCDPGFTGHMCDTVAALTIPPTKLPPTLAPATAETLGQNEGISTGVISGILVTTLLLITIVIATVFLYRRRVGCFNRKKRHVKSTQNGHVIESNGNMVSYDLAYPAEVHGYGGGANGSRSAAGRRRRRRRRRHQSSSSDQSSDSNGENSLPTVIYDVPITDNLPKGILKKPSIVGEDNSQCSDSQCSCAEHSSSCSSGDEEMPENINTCTIPKPSLDNIDLACKVSPSNSEDAKFSSSTEADQQYRLKEDLNHSMYPSMRVNHDSASDSAIELHHGDSSMSTLNEPSAFIKVSPPYRYTRPNQVQYVAASHPLPASNSPSVNTLTDHYMDIESVLPGNSYSPSGTTPIKMKIPTPNMHNECDASESLLEDEHEGTTLECHSMYSIRPQNGPMRTFRPIQKQRKPSKKYGAEMTDSRKPFIM